MGLSPHQLLRFVPDVTRAIEVVERAQATKPPDERASRDEIAQMALLQRCSIAFTKTALLDPEFREVCKLPKEPEELNWNE
jgi:hypothetical protein